MARIFLKMYDYWILGMTLIIWSILAFLPEGFIPDFLNLKRVISSGTFGRISTAFISVFSFLVTVLVLTYGFLREKFRRLTLREFLENKFSKGLVSFFISVFIVNLFSAIYLDSREVDHNSLNVAYFSLFMSATYFLSFLPLALLSIANTDSQSLIAKYIEKLELENFPEVHSIEALATYDERNPITVLVQLSRSYVEKDDFHSINLIIFLSQNRIETLIRDSKDRNLIGRYLSGQRLIWDAIVQKSFQKKEYSAIQNIFISLSTFHNHFSKNKIPLLFLEELRFFIHSLIERMVDEGLNEQVENAIVIYEKILEYHYNNSAPQESDLKELIHFFEQSEESYKEAYGGRTRSNSYNTVHQWNALYSGIPYFFSIIIYKSIEKKNLVLFDRAIGSIQHLIHALYLSKLSDRQKAWIVRMLSGEFHEFQIVALKKGLAIDRINTLESIIVDKMIDENSLAKEFALVSASEFLINLHKLGKLNYEAINFLGSIGRHCANNYAEDARYVESFNYILRVVEHFKKLLEIDLRKNGQLYRWLADAVDSYIRFHKDPNFGRRIEKGEQKKIDTTLVERLDKLLKSFEPIDFKDEEFRVEWDVNGPREMYSPELKKENRINTEK